MNGTIGRGTTVHSLTGDYATCGKGMGRNSVSRTSAPIDCKACLKMVPTEVKTEITYSKNTLARGWVTKTQVYTGTPEATAKVLANMVKSAGFRLISSIEL